jgi:pimeloyl-ACP methyl ester carboxylesterase
MSGQPDSVSSADGTPIAVWRSGAGPPLVLVHGTAADHARWAPVLPALGERYTVLAMDRRGRGASGDADAYALEREYEDVAAVVDAAGDPVDVIGHSHGAQCALHACLLTGNVRRLVLYEPPMGLVVAEPETVARLEELGAAGEWDAVVAYFLGTVAGVPPEQLELMRSLPAWQARLAAAGTIAREERASREYEFEPGAFADLRVPTLLLSGGASPPAFAEAIALVHGALPDSRVAVMPGQRHVAIDTGTDLFLAEVLSFLEAG